MYACVWQGNAESELTLKSHVAYRLKYFGIADRIKHFMGGSWRSVITIFMQRSSMHGIDTKNFLELFLQLVQKMTS